MELPGLLDPTVKYVPSISTHIIPNFIHPCTILIVTWLYQRYSWEHEVKRFAICPNIMSKALMIQATYEDNGSDKDNDSEKTFIAKAVQRHWVNYTSTRHIINV